LPVSLPFGKGAQLEGVLDLLQQRVVTSRTEAATVQQAAIPENERTMVTDALKRVQEGVAEQDDRLLEQYLALGELTQEELISGLRLGVQARTIVPLLRFRNQEYRDRSTPQRCRRIPAVADGAGHECPVGRPAS
jgi:elongation factor G